MLKKSEKDDKSKILQEFRLFSIDNAEPVVGF